MAVKQKSFWSSTTGFVTGVAGIVTAVAGLATVATQAGWIGGSGDNSSDVKTTQTTLAPDGTYGGGGASGGAATGGSGTPSFTVDPQSVNFAAISPRKAPVTVVNGAVQAAVGTPTVEGANPSAFSATSNCPSRLEAGGKCTIDVTFSPPKSGSYNAVLVVRVTGAPVKNVTLKGEAIL